MGKNGDTEIEFTESEELLLLVAEHEQQLKKVEQQLDEMHQKLDFIAQKMEHTSFNSKTGLFKKIAPKLDKFVHRLSVLFIVILAFSAISLAFVSFAIAELMAQISLFCVVAAVILEIIRLVIGKAELLRFNYFEGDKKSE